MYSVCFELPDRLPLHDRSNSWASLVDRNVCILKAVCPSIVPLVAFLLFGTQKVSHPELVYAIWRLMNFYSLRMHGKRGSASKDENGSEKWVRQATTAYQLLEKCRAWNRQLNQCLLRRRTDMVLTDTNPTAVSSENPKRLYDVEERQKRKKSIAATGKLESNRKHNRSESSMT